MSALKRLPWSYLLLAYGWAWLLWIPVALTRTDYQSSSLLVLVLLLGVFGPGVAGILLTYRDRDPVQRSLFWKRLLDWRRVAGRWVIFMLIVWPALHSLANLLAGYFGSPPPASELLAQVAAQPAFAMLVVALYFLQAALEDLGWRGYMGEQLLRSTGPGTTAALVGIFHAFWHLPLFFIVGTNQATIGLGPDFWLFVVQAVAFSFFATWCYVDNAHSTLAAILLHTVANLSNDIFTLAGGTLKFQLYTMLMILAALALQALMSRSGKARLASSLVKEPSP
jgi:membrane protease YdiL (CAAX protease family)